MELRVIVGRRGLLQPGNLGRVQMVTRHVFDVKLDAKDRGKQAIYFGRWRTRRGLYGPWSSPVMMTVV